MENKLHVGIIMDGNRRWGKKHPDLSLQDVYKVGAESLSRCIDAALKNNIKFLTVYAFSTENWNRDTEEIVNIKYLLEYYLNKESENIIKKQIKFTIIGDYSQFGCSITKQIDDLQNKTKNFNSITLTVALNYGSKDEILRAVNNIVNDSNVKKPVTEEVFNSYLYTRYLPNLDMIIRTGGEHRLSNFLLWQASYAELFFLKILWPDFTEEDFNNCINQYKKREIRKGK